jgi:uncharacterized protein YdeI (BOF family)
MKRSTIVVAFAAVLATLVAATAAFAGDSNGKTLFRYAGQFKGLDGTSMKVTVQNGNRAALRSLLGQSQDQTFATDDHTVFIRWTNGAPQQVNLASLALNDYVTVNVRADRSAPLDTINDKPAASVADRGQTLNQPDKPLYLFRGTLVSTDTSGKVTIDVKGGNHRALRLMIGHEPRQTFSTDGDTVFLHWAHRIPTVINAAGLEVGDRIVIRIRADRGLDLAQVEAIAAKRVADREPKAQESHQSAQA